MGIACHLHKASQHCPAGDLLHLLWPDHVRHLLPSRLQASFPRSMSGSMEGLCISGGMPIVLQWRKCHGLRLSIHDCESVPASLARYQLQMLTTS